jgi:hypothetical protein
MRQVFRFTFKVLQVLLAILVGIFIGIPILVISLFSPSLRRKIKSLSSSYSPYRFTAEDSEDSESLSFLMQVLLATRDGSGDARAVYPLLQANLEKLDAGFIQILRNWASQTLGEAEAKEARSIAVDIVNFSTLIQQFPLGSRAINLEIGIAGYEIAHTVFSRETAPEAWATIQNNLAAAYSDRIRGERAENIEAAISCYIAALEVRTRAAFPQDWATTQNNLATAYYSTASEESERRI